jgi:hypothetical protein
MSGKRSNARVVLAAAFCAAVAAFGGVGCEHVVYVSETNFGVNVTAASQGTPKLSLGYDRETYAIVPRFNEGNGKPPEAMSLVSVSKVDSTGLDELIFNHYIVTGEAAEKAALDPVGLRQMREAIFGGDAGD